MTDDTAVAIVGIGGRFPGADSVTELWRNLRSGTCSITDFTEQELLDAGVPASELGHPSYVRSKGFLREADRFEAELFGFTDTEAAILDPQHRVLLETAWSALEDGGYNPRAVPVNTGVYVGGSLSEHMLAGGTDPRLVAEHGELTLRLHTDRDFLASWLSYRLGLEGPSMAVQTACSSSLTAVHLAVQALLVGECDLALAGGVSIDTIHPRGYRYFQGGVGSPDGRCRPFDAEAGGTLTGNGAGLVVLRRLSDALRDGDPVRAVIRGSAVTNDGRGKVGFSAPSAGMQASALIEAWAAAGLTPAAAQYLEMHGTGTALGDQIEVSAVSEALADATSRCGIGSIKANIGHLDAAAGIAGLIKVVLMLSHRTMVPTPNVHRPHPDLKLDETPLYVVDRTTEWPANDAGTRLAGVTSVGMGGTNVHVVVEQAPGRAPGESGQDTPELLLLSAATPAQVATLATAVADALDGPVRLSDVARTLRVARAPLATRAYVVADTARAAAGALTALETGGLGEAREEPAGPIFVFPGQGTQYRNMATSLAARFPVLRRELDRCAEILADRYAMTTAPWTRQDVHDPRYGQVALVSVQYALARQWEQLGIRPAAMVGHSVGEYTVACLAGVISLEDVLGIVVARGELMARTAPGKMLAVPLSEAQVAPLLGAGVELAAGNGPTACVLSGTGNELDRIAASLAADGVPHRFLDVTRAFHSALMDPILDDIAELFRRVTLTAPAIPYVSGVTGQWITAAEATDPKYWVAQVREPVRFHDAVATAGRATSGPVLECGPGRGLSAQARKTLPGREAVALLGSDAEHEERTALQSLGKLWALGHDPRFDQIDDADARRVNLPTYPFAGTRYGAFTPAARQTVISTAEPARATTAPAQVARTESDDGRRTAITDLLVRTLGLADAGDLHRGYLEAGGDSLTAVHVIGRLRDEFDIDVPVTLLLEPIPLREVVERITEIDSGPGLDWPLEEYLKEIESQKVGD